MFKAAQHFLPFICSASGCPLASKNKALREQLSGNVKYSNGSTPSFGNRLAALSNNSYDPEGLSQDKTSPNNDPNDEKVRRRLIQWKCNNGETTYLNFHGSFW